LIVAVVLAAVAVGADRLAVHIVEGKAADRLAGSAGLASTPDVSIKGFPFLTQVVSGDLDEIDASISGYDSTVPGGATAHLEDLQLRLNNVRFSNSFSSATARTATGTALVPYAELVKAAPSNPDTGTKVTRISAGGGNRLKVEVAADGQTYTVLSTVEVDPKENTIRVKAQDLPTNTGADESRLRAATDFQQTLTRLPGGVTLQSATPTPEGLNLTVGGTDVSLTG
jgi:hypothetical protein